MMNTKTLSATILRGLCLASLATLLPLIRPPVLAQIPVNLIAYWDFNDATNPNQAVSGVGGYVGVFENGVAYTVEGHSGQIGDRAVDFGTTAAARAIRSSDVAGALNAAAAGDRITISFWLRWSTTPVNSSAFWFTSASSAVGQRGAQGHVPFGNNTIYFDTGGTTANTQRLQAGQPTGIDWQQWHHIAYVKNAGSKQIWIDGTLIAGQAAGTPARPLVTDFTEILLGLDRSNTANQFRGLMDDFAVFEGALESGPIQALAGGSSPTTIPELAADTDNDGIPGWWEDLHGLNKADAADADLDADSDGLKNRQEYQLGTRPNDDDSDDDGVKDGVETNTGTWVSANATGTNPLNADTDGDGLPDGVETNTGVFADAGNPGSRPVSFDTDGDRYSDGAEVITGSSPVSATSIPNLGTGVKLLAFWDFNDSSVATQALDRVRNIPGILVNGVIYTADQGGWSGKPGDLSADWGTTAATRAIRSRIAGAWLAAAAVGDQITVSYWQQWSIAPVNSSIFWFVSPSSSGGQRGFQGHVPYGDSIVYFDTAGCCAAGTQRLNANIGTLNVPAFSFLQWHHIAYVKNGPGKQVWIDGQLFMEGTGASPLPNDINELVLGLDVSNTASQYRGRIDDFAVFASALDEGKIAALSSGISPQDIELATGDTDSDGLPDWYEEQNGFDKSNSADAAQDTDVDGLNNVQEYQAKTNPRDDDSDDDGLKDGVEIALTTNPLNADTDGDTLKDGVETGTGRFVSAADTGTLPTQRDSDGDLYADGIEVILGSSPVNVNSIPATPGAVNLLAFWDFNDASVTNQTVDRIHRFVGELMNGVAFSADQTGRTGQAGDRAVNFGTTPVLGRGVRVAGAQWLNAAGIPNVITVSYWQRWTAAIANSSSFWFVSPSSAASARGAHAETPFGNGGISWDTGGTTVGTQRIQANINTFGPYTNAPNSSNSTRFWTNWHHFAFVKNGTAKQIWIDGALFLEGVNTGGLPIDFTEIFLGVEPGGANNMRGLIDDFAVYASPLDPAKITLLAQGASPIDFGPVPPALFSITSATLSTAAQTLAITWQSQAGQKYAVQQSQNLADWTTVTQVDASAGSTTTYSAALSAGPGANFYRIQRQ